MRYCQYVMQQKIYIYYSDPEPLVILQCFTWKAAFIHHKVSILNIQIEKSSDIDFVIFFKKESIDIKYKKRRIEGRFHYDPDLGYFSRVGFGSCLSWGLDPDPVLHEGQLPRNRNPPFTRYFTCWKSRPEE